MSSIRNELTLVIGSDLALELTVQRPNGSPIDLTGATVYWRMKRATSDAAALISKVSPTNITITIPLKGKAQIFIDATDTEAVLATGTITTVAGALLVDGETFTIDDGDGATTFEFDSDGTIDSDFVTVPFTAADSADVVRDAVIAAIAGESGFSVTASNGGAATVNLVQDLASFDGNIALTEDVAAGGFAVTGMTGGVGFEPGTYVYDCWVDLAAGARHNVIPPSPLHIVKPVSVL